MAMLRNPSDDHEESPIKGLIGSGPAMREVYRMTRKVAVSNASVLLVGETGTGKELIAKAIHQLSPRGTGPFDDVLEFSHVSGPVIFLQALHHGCVNVNDVTIVLLVVMV